MSATKVDVHGVLERAGADPDAPEGSQAWALAQVDAAVADLIEAAKEMAQQDAVQRATHNTNPFMADAADKLLCALRKVGAR